MAIFTYRTHKTTSLQFLLTMPEAFLAWKLNREVGWPGPSALLLTTDCYSARSSLSVFNNSRSALQHTQNKPALFARQVHPSLFAPVRAQHTTPGRPLYPVNLDRITRILAPHAPQRLAIRMLSAP